MMVVFALKTVKEYCIVYIYLPYEHKFDARYKIYLCITFEFRYKISTSVITVWELQ
jgi:hypothetical protein